MAQQVLTGRTGLVTGLACRIYLWECTFHTDALESTGFGSTWRNREVGFQDGKGRATARLTEGSATDDPTTIFNGAKHSLVLTANSGDTFSFLAVVTDVIPTVNVDRVSEVTFNFESDGAISMAWNETT